MYQMYKHFLQPSKSGDYYVALLDFFCLELVSNNTMSHCFTSAGGLTGEQLSEHVRTHTHTYVHTLEALI